MFLNMPFPTLPPAPFPPQKPHSCLHPAESTASWGWGLVHSAVLPVKAGFVSGHAEPPVARHWGHHIVTKVMNAFPGRAQQAPTSSRPAGAVSLAGAQAAAPSQRPQPAAGPPAKSHAGTGHEAQEPSDAVGSRPATTASQLAAAPELQSPSQNVDCSRHQATSPAGDLTSTHPAEEASCGTSAQAAPQHQSPATAPTPEAATLADRPDTTVDTSQQQDNSHRQQHSAPSILQDLRDAAAQDCAHQSQDPPAPADVLSGEQALLVPAQSPRQQALLEEAQSSQETASTQQAHRLSAASPSAETDACTHGEAFLPRTVQPCLEAQAPTALPPLAPASTGPAAEQATPAGLDHCQQLAVASQRLVGANPAVADNPESLPSVPVLAAVVHAMQDKQQHVVRSLRLSEKRAAAEQAAAQAAAEEEAVLRERDMLMQAAVKQTALDLASKVEAADSAVPLVLAECLAGKRSRRVPGGDPLEVSTFFPRPPPLLLNCCPTK